MRQIVLNGRWPMWLPEHRAAREEWSSGWEVERLDSMASRIQPGWTVFDVGAEEGEFGALAAQWVGPTGGVCLFEPNPLVIPNERAIFEANDLTDRVREVFSGFAADVTDEAGEAWLSQAPPAQWPLCAYGPVIGDHGFSRVEERPDLPRVTLDDFCVRRSILPDAITMDVEGTELIVMRGAERILREHRPLVWISVHPEFMAHHYGQSDSELHEFMAECGYDGEHLATDHEEHWAYTPR